MESLLTEIQVATVSALALMVEIPIFGSFAQYGTG